MSVPSASPVPPVSEAFIFVVDGSLLETQSMLLAASLHRVHRDLPQARTFAYVSARSQNLPELVRAVYDAARVEVRLLPDPGAHWSKAYPHGNKILACAEPRDVDRTTFLDTDILVTRPLCGLAEAGDDRVLMVPEGLPTWGADGQWERAYAHIGQDLPAERVTLVRGRELSYPPYFNAGFINFPERPLAATGTRFAAEWLALASDFDHRCPVRLKRPWLDQITLPLTLYKHGLGWKVLPDIYNYSLAKRDRIRRRERLVKVMHYHSLKYLALRPVWAEAVQTMRDMIPARLQGALDAAFTLPEDEVGPALLQAGPVLSAEDKV